MKTNYIPFFEDSQNLKLLLEWVDEIDSDGELKSELEMMYEWEYKYSKIKVSINARNEKRVSNILKTIRMKLNPILNSIIEKLATVFESWLGSHALLSPRTWAEKRVEELENGGDSYEETIMESAFYEWVRYAYNTPRDTDKYNDEFYSKVFIAVYDQIDDQVYDYAYSMNDFHIANYRDDLKSAKTDEERQGLQERIDQLENFEGFSNAEEALDYIENSYGDAKEYLDYITINDDDIVIAAFEKVVFPVWFEYWEAEGIVETRENVQKVYDNLITSQNEPDMSKKMMNINIALNTSHQTGSMMEYVNERFGVSKNDLDELNDIGEGKIAEWDKEVNLNVK